MFMCIFHLFTRSNCLISAASTFDDEKFIKENFTDIFSSLEKKRCFFLSRLVVCLLLFQEVISVSLIPPINFAFNRCLICLGLNKATFGL